MKFLPWSARRNSVKHKRRTETAATPTPVLWPTSEGDREIYIDPDCEAVNLCGLAGPAPYRHRGWRELHRELLSYSCDRHVFSPNVCRKGWEWTQAAYGLQKLGMLRREYSALGVGAGRECLIFWLGDRVGRVLATDLYGNLSWSTQGGREADEEVVRDPQKYCPRPADLSRIQFMNMDGTRLAARDNSF